MNPHGQIEATWSDSEFKATAFSWPDLVTEDEQGTLWIVVASSMWVVQVVKDWDPNQTDLCGSVDGSMELYRYTFSVMDSIYLVGVLLVWTACINSVQRYLLLSFGVLRVLSRRFHVTPILCGWSFWSVFLKIKVHCACIQPGSLIVLIVSAQTMKLRDLKGQKPKSLYFCVPPEICSDWVLPWSFTITSWLVISKAWCNSWETFGRKAICAMWCSRAQMV